jgi:hypothetical protein
MIYYENAIGSIRLRELPEGRQATPRIHPVLIGLVVPCLYRIGANDTPCNGGLREIVPTYAAYAVLQSHAMQVLAEARSWRTFEWRGLGFPNYPGALFHFELESAEEVSPVLSRWQFRELGLPQLEC